MAELTAKQRMAIPRQPMPEQEAGERRANFFEVAPGLTPEMAQQEAERSRYRRNREDYLRRDREYAERHPERIAAKNKVNTEIRAGRLSRQPCEECGAENAEAHHDDYSKPRDVRWLCPTHHRRHHNEISDMP